jgi:hypothetical protein
MSRKAIRAWLALAFLAVAGFALGTYGVAVGSAQSTDTTGTVTTTETITESSTTVETAITTVVTTSTPPTTTTPTTTAATTTTTAESSSSNTPWAWIAIGCGLAAVILIGFLLWQRSRAGTSAWRTRAANLNRRCLVALDDVLARGSVVTGQIEALAAEARSLEASAPDDASKASAGDVRARLGDLAQALESDRALRLGSPPPSEEQLSYSTSLIRQQVEQLQGSLRRPGAG